MNDPNEKEVEKLLLAVDDLLVQATKERTHYYTANVLRRCRAFIVKNSKSRPANAEPWPIDEMNEVRKLLFEIEMQATRMERACDNKDYLKHDLKMIENMAKKAFKIQVDSLKKKGLQ